MPIAKVNIRRMLVFGSVAVAATTLGAASIASRFTTSERRELQREALLLVEFLQGYHYADRPFIELDAREVLEQFAGGLDPWRLFLTGEDVAFIRRRFERNLKSVYLFRGDLYPAYEIWDLFAARAAARGAWIEARLGGQFDLTGTGKLDLARANDPWPADAAAADEKWERWLKAELIDQHLAGASLAAARERVRQRHAAHRRAIQQMDPHHVRELFLNSMLSVFDPHSGYFSRETAGRIERLMSATQEGVGLEIATHDGRVYVESIDPAGPADRQGDIHPGDELLAIGQPGGRAKKLVELNEREVQALLASDGSGVEVHFRRPGESRVRQATLERAKVQLASRRARGSVSHVPLDGTTRRIGSISLPAFYGPAEPGNAAGSVSSDVTEILQAFMEEKVQALVLDLRDNAGGLLDEAVRLAGLFIRTGPIAYIRGLEQRVVAQSDTDSSVAFRGPLVVLTSPRSASASELVAGALKHYDRCLLVGGQTTFGKGTAQDAIDLSRLSVATEAGRNGWGVMRVTRQYFYLPGGSSPQQLGVPPHLQLPDAVMPQISGESKLPHALPHESIEPLERNKEAVRDLVTVDPPLVASLRARLNRRVEREPEFAVARRMAATNDDPATHGSMLNLAERTRVLALREAANAAMRRDHNRIHATCSYPATTIRTRIGTDVDRIHQSALRARLERAGAGPNRFVGDTYYHELGPGGRIREIRAHDLNYGSFADQCESLALAWTNASGVPLNADAMTGILRAMNLRKRSRNPDETVEAVFRRFLPEGASHVQISAGLDAFFAVAAALEPEKAGEVPPLDVGLRECLRLAAEWVHTISASDPAVAAASGSLSAP